MDSVDFLDGDVIDIFNKGFQKEMEMVDACFASIKKVVGSDAMVIINTRADSSQDFSGVFQSYSWYFISSTAQVDDVFIVSFVSFKC